MQIYTDEFQLLVKPGLLKGAAGGDVGLTTDPASGNRHGRSKGAWKIIEDSPLDVYLKRHIIQVQKVKNPDQESIPTN